MVLYPYRQYKGISCEFRTDNKFPDILFQDSRQLYFIIFWAEGDLPIFRILENL